MCSVLKDFSSVVVCEILVVLPVQGLVVHDVNYVGLKYHNSFLCVGNLALLGHSRTTVVVLAPRMVGGFKALH